MQAEIRKNSPLFAIIYIYCQNIPKLVDFVDTAISLSSAYNDFGYNEQVPGYNGTDFFLSKSLTAMLKCLVIFLLPAAEVSGR